MYLDAQIRITSYNVCYTKLLRLAGFACLHILKQAGQSNTKIPHVVEIISRPDGVSAHRTNLRMHNVIPDIVQQNGVVFYDRGNRRITSYNVCYTKLLRALLSKVRSGYLMMEFARLIEVIENFPLADSDREESDESG